MFNEKQVISGIIAGDVKAFEVLVKQYERLVFHVINRLVTDDADKADICQEVFIKVYKGIDTFKFQSKLSTWIARVAYLTGINHIKKNKKYREPYPADPDEYFFTTDTPEEMMIRRDAAGYVNTLIAQMPEQYRIVITLYHLNEFSYREIEDITGMPEGTIKSYLYRARKLLKEKLEAYLKTETA